MDGMGNVGAYHFPAAAAPEKNAKKANNGLVLFYFIPPSGGKRISYHGVLCLFSCKVDACIFILFTRSLGVLRGGSHFVFVVIRNMYATHTGGCIQDKRKMAIRCGGMSEKGKRVEAANAASVFNIKILNNMRVGGGVEVNKNYSECLSF